jgi:hypothetical protein
VCINQVDNVGKSRQANVMQKIYSCTSSVVAWLGPATEYSSMVMDALGNIEIEALNTGVLKLNIPETMMRAAASNPAATPLDRNPFMIKYALDALSDHHLVACAGWGSFPTGEVSRSCKNAL